jgi:hypothetical protein
MPRSPLQFIGATCNSCSPDVLEKLRERCQSKWLLANHSATFPGLIQGLQFNSTEPLPMLRSSAILTGCVRTSDWPSNFPMCDAHGSNAHMIPLVPRCTCIRVDGGVYLSMSMVQTPELQGNTPNIGVRCACHVSKITFWDMVWK